MYFLALLLLGVLLCKQLLIIADHKRVIFALLMTSLLSTATVTAVGLTCKVFFNIGFFSVTVNGLPILLNALENDARTQGVVTGSLAPQNLYIRNSFYPSFKSHLNVSVHFSMAPSPLSKVPQV